MGRERRAPGWYVDPDDPDALRHWGGWSWGTRRRPRPGWTRATAELRLDRSAPVVEGPVRRQALARTADGTVAGSPARGWSALRPPARRAPQWDGPSADSLGRPPRLPDGRLAWARPRRPLVVVGAMGAICLLIAAFTPGLLVGRPASLLPATFVRAANQACTSGLAGVAGRVGDGSTAAPATAAGQGHQLATAADRVAAVAAQLRSEADLSAAPATVNGWLAAWTRWDGDARRYAAVLAAVVPGSVPDRDTTTSLQRAVDLDAATADGFASANGLTSCLLLQRVASPVIATS